MASGAISEVYRGVTIYYTPPPERVWSFRPGASVPLQSYRSAFQARRAINQMLDGFSESTPRRTSSAMSIPNRREPPSVPRREPPTRARVSGTVEEEIGRLLGADTSRSVTVTLPESQRQVQVPAFQRLEQRFAGELPANFRTVPNKVAVDFDGAAVYPEFAIIRRLEAAGWNAAWRKNWHGAAFWSDISTIAVIPAETLAIFDAVASTAGAGAWDILAWKGRRVLFIESKQYGSDKLTPNQLRWLETALDQGIPLQAFAIYEYRA